MAIGSATTDGSQARKAPCELFELVKAAEVSIVTRFLRYRFKKRAQVERGSSRAILTSALVRPPSRYGFENPPESMHMTDFRLKLGCHPGEAAHNSAKTA